MVWQTRPHLLDLLVKLLTCLCTQLLAAYEELMAFLHESVLVKQPLDGVLCCHSLPDFLDLYSLGQLNELASMDLGS